jgi:hypothetical protein
VGKFHEYLRYPSRFSRVENNLRKLDLVGPNLRAWLSYTVSILNACHLPDAIIWKEQQGYKNIVNNRSRPPVSTRLLHYPEHLNLQYMPPQAKAYVAARLEKGLERVIAQCDLTAAKTSSVKKLFAGIIAFMQEKDLSAHWPYYWKSHTSLDLLRKQSFRDLEPELFALLDQPTALGSVTQPEATLFSSS